MTARRKVSEAQRVGHAMVTRGMDKSAIPFATQVLAGRTDKQRQVRKLRSCVRCEGPRDGTFPVCPSCRGEA